MSRPIQHASYSTVEYLDMEADSSVKHEYIAGEVYAMSGASERHNRIALNAAYRFRTATRGGRCGVYISDMKLRIQAKTAFNRGRDAHCWAPPAQIPACPIRAPGTGLLPWMIDGKAVIPNGR